MRLLRSKSLVFDVYAAFLRPQGGWVAIADLVALLEDVGVDGHAVRSSVSRFRHKGLLVRRVRGGEIGYELSDHARAILSEGDVRIYSQEEPARLDDGWVLATFSVPEELRSERHQLRTRLTWLGFGSLGGGVWLAPARVKERTIAAVSEMGLTSYVDIFAAHYHAFDTLDDLVKRCWDVPRMRKLYAAFIEEFTSTSDRWEHEDPGENPREAFIDFVAAIHEWRKIPYADPGLPRELLPYDWEGTAAIELFRRLRGRLEPAATVHVDGVVRGA
jgi:phenylacetic acid degradation operon negative regulatory protein